MLNNIIKGDVCSTSAHTFIKKVLKKCKQLHTSEMREDIQNSGIEEHPFNIEIFIPISSFDLGHLLRLCSGDIFLVSDVLDTFCVEGSQRIESLRKAADREDMDAVVCEAVRSAAHLHFFIQ